MRAIVLALVIVLYSALPAMAQLQAPSPSPEVGDLADRAAQASTPDDDNLFTGSILSGLGHKFARLPSKQTAITLGIGGALALAMHPADRQVSARASASEPLDDVFEIGAVTGSGWVQIGGALGTYVLGRAGGKPRVVALGADLVQVQIVNTAMTLGLKLAVRRTRPDQGSFSFPSGHASAMFATATVLQRRFGWRVGLAANGLAAYVAASRVQENRHYSSDVIFGAAIGVAAGQTIGRGVGRFVVSPVVVPGGAGVTLSRAR